MGRELVKEGYDVFGKCDCGWEGKRRNYMSDNYAYTNVRNDIAKHKCMPKEIDSTELDNSISELGALLHG
jgi:hypothetical protein